MHPYLIGKLSSYSVMLVLGVLAAVSLFRVLSAVLRTPNEVYNRYSLAAIVSIAVGLCSAFLFQAVYDWAKTGEFHLTGLTFMGGLAGGVLTFVLFAVTSKTHELRLAFFSQAEIAAPCISLAHGLGRIGCLLAGCCYGKPSEHGLYFETLGYRAIPTQLYEALFLFALTAVLLFMLLKKHRGFNIITYATSYAIFRFIIEFFRDDDRGGLNIALSPSQVMSIVLLAAAVALIVVRVKFPRLFEILHTPAPEVGAADALAMPENDGNVVSDGNVAGDKSEVDSGDTVPSATQNDDGNDKT